MVVENEEPYIGGRYLLFLELVTDEGITGLGERVTGGAYSRNLGDLKSQISLIEELVGQYVIGEDPFRIERIWDRMYASRHDFRHPSLYATPVISAIDMVNRHDTLDEKTVRHQLEGNICRCTGYHNIVKAILAAHPVMKGQ